MMEKYHLDVDLYRVYRNLAIGGMMVGMSATLISLMLHNIAGMGLSTMVASGSAGYLMGSSTAENKFKAEKQSELEKKVTQPGEK